MPNIGGSKRPILAMARHWLQDVLNYNGNTRLNSFNDGSSSSFRLSRCLLYENWNTEEGFEVLVSPGDMIVNEHRWIPHVIPKFDEIANAPLVITFAVFPWTTTSSLPPGRRDRKEETEDDRWFVFRVDG